MVPENQTMEEKCEHLMLAVVESRKRFGNMCVDYEQKASLMENKMMHLQLKIISNCRFKQLHQIRNDTKDTCKDTENFTVQITERQRKIDEFKKRIKNTQDIVLQLKADNVAKKLKQPLTVEAMLGYAKLRKLQ